MLLSTPKPPGDRPVTHTVNNTFLKNRHAMGARRHGQEGALAPPLLKCCKVFCAVVTAKLSADELFMHYFHNLSSASGGFAPRLPPGASFLDSAGGLLSSDP